MLVQRPATWDLKHVRALHLPHSITHATRAQAEQDEVAELVQRLTEGASSTPATDAAMPPTSAYPSMVVDAAGELRLDGPPEAREGALQLVLLRLAGAEARLLLAQGDSFAARCVLEEALGGTGRAAPSRPPAPAGTQPAADDASPRVQLLVLWLAEAAARVRSDLALDLATCLMLEGDLAGAEAALQGALAAAPAAQRWRYSDQLGAVRLLQGDAAGAQAERDAAHRGGAAQGWEDALACLAALAGGQARQGKLEEAVVSYR